jgi:hypothetical protein
MGTLCANGYSNLMTNPLDILCNKPIAIERMIIHGFNDPDDVIAVSYILPGNVTTYSPGLLIPIIGNEQTVETNHIPPLLVPLFRIDRGNQLNLITTTGKLFIHASSTTYHDKTDLTIYDLESLKSQQVEFNACLKDAGILK